jgi:hypothetical protein
VKEEQIFESFTSAWWEETKERLLETWEVKGVQFDMMCGLVRVGFFGFGFACCILYYHMHHSVGRALLVWLQLNRPFARRTNKVTIQRLFEKLLRDIDMAWK